MSIIVLTKAQQSAVVQSILKRLKRYPGSYNFAIRVIPVYTGNDRGPRQNVTCLLGWAGYYIHKLTGQRARHLADVASALGFEGEREFYGAMHRHAASWSGSAAVARATLMSLAQSRGL